MAINIKPDISLSGKPPTMMTLPEMVNMARSAQAYQRESELFPELVQQAKTQTQQSQFSLDKDQTAVGMSILGGRRNDPRIESGNADQAIEAMNEIRAEAIAAGIPQQKVDTVLRMGFAIAERNPEKLGRFIDNVIQSQIGAPGQQLLQTGETVTSGGQIGLLRKGLGTITPLKILQPETAPAAPAAPAAAAAPAVAPAVAPAAVPQVEQVIFAHLRQAKNQQL